MSLVVLLIARLAYGQQPGQCVGQVVQCVLVGQRDRELLPAALVFRDALGESFSQIVNHLAGWFRRRLLGDELTQEVECRAQQLADNAVLFDDPGRMNTVEARVGAVTPEQIQAVVAKYFQPTNRTVVITTAGAARGGSGRSESEEPEQ